MKNMKDVNLLLSFWGVGYVSLHSLGYLRRLSSIDIVYVSHCYDSETSRERVYGFMTVKPICYSSNHRDSKPLN
jgi:hypothetical protein